MTIKHHVTWEQYFELCYNIIQQIKDQGITDIIGIARGGLIPAQYIAYSLDIERVHSCGIQTYTPDHKKMSNTFKELYQKVDVSDWKNRNILILDDIADTGDTFQIFLDNHYFSPESNNKIYTAALHYKQKKCHFGLNYWAEDIASDTWVVYPYD